MYKNLDTTKNEQFFRNNRKKISKTKQNQQKKNLTLESQQSKRVVAERKEGDRGKGVVGSVARDEEEMEEEPRI